MSSRRCKTFLLGLLAPLSVAAPAFAQNCLQDEFSKVQPQTLNCTANDVRVAQVVNIRDPVTGQKLTTCFQGTHFNFLADFEIVTSSTSSRSNIGLYFATNSTTQALTGTCADNIISPAHGCPSNSSITCGSDNYHELDGGQDNCGDTSSTDSSPVFGAGAEGVTIEVDNFLCNAPAGSTTLVLPNCTSWQVPGKTNLCQSNPPDFPYPAPPAAVPGSPSKCNCSVISLPITPIVAQATMTKACTTALTQGLHTLCDAGPEGSTVTYTDTITNTTNVGGITIDQICDSAYGQVFPQTGTCAAGTVGKISSFGGCSTFDIANGGSATCTFTAAQGELAKVTDVATVSGHSDINTSSKLSTQSNSVEVDSEDAPSTAKVTKGFVGTEAGCATVRYSVDVHNSSTADEVLTLSSLTDTAFGDITKVGTTAPPVILGTTCGVTSGQGTLAGSAGAGTLPTSIAVGGDYKCQFDGQFCSAVDVNSCISNTDSVSGVLTGDESEAVTETENTLTVKECFTATVTSK